MKQTLVLSLFALFTLFSAGAINIVCDDLSDDNPNTRLSAFLTHTFHLSKGESGNINEPCWTLYRIDGDSKIKIDENHELEFTMPTLVSLSEKENFILDYTKNFSCSLEFTGMNDNSPVQVAPLDFSIDFKPIVTNAEITGIEYSEDGKTFKASYKVWCIGADLLDVTSEYQYSSVAECQSYRDPDYVEGTTRWILCLNKSWINLTSRNTAGSDTWRIEFDKGATSWHKVGENLTSVPTTGMDSPEIVGYEIYDTNGLRLWEGTDLNAFLAETNHKGAYIIKAISSTGKIRVIKHIK